MRFYSLSAFIFTHNYLSESSNYEVSHRYENLKENTMKKSLLHSMVLSVGTLVLVASTSALAGENPKAHNSYPDKKTAEEFWSEFKQDSKQTWKDSKSAFKDGWIESKLETALILNKHLNPFKIDIGVDNNIATLEGEVNTDIDKELAENIALGIEGIDSVKNNLKVVKQKTSVTDSTKDTKRDFSQYVEDVSTTAAIKTELLASKNVKGLNINVDTLNDEVTLSGKVNTAEEKALAQAIAAKHDDVKNVINNLQVKS
jgi:hyperosmotically inducible periplasmic protein